MSIIIPANTLAGGFDVDNSLRFERASNDALNITPSNASNRKTFTVSAWIKKVDLTSNTTTTIISARVDGSNNFDLSFEDDFKLRCKIEISDDNYFLRSTALYRDLSAWYHVVLAVDTTQATDTNRVKLYVNGVILSSFATSTFPDRNADTSFNNTNVHQIGGTGTGGQTSMYLSEMVVIDGQALAATSFGEFDEDSGIWKPIKVSGLTFGTNGFYLEFKQAGTGTNASGMGADTSGNTNHLAVANLTAVDQSTDTCTNNFATFNSLTPSLQSGGVVAYSEGNTKIVTAYSNTNYLRYPQAYTTLGVTTGKWYAEFKIGAIGSAGVGIANTGEFGSDVTTNPFAGAADSGAVYTNGGEYRSGIAEAGSQGTYTENDIIGCALDMDNLAIYWHKNGTYINSGNPTSGSSKTGARAVQNPTTPGGFYVFTAGADNTGVATIEINLGSPSYSESGGETDGGGIGNFNQAVPSGYFALCTKNLAKHG